MCLEHASAIDDPALVGDYPAEVLLEWKAKQLEEFDRLAQSWALSPEMADEVIKASSASEVNFSNSLIHLGGEGGRSPGAGGGGGGAIGRKARGGRAGDGGGHRIEEGMYTRPPVQQGIDTRLHVAANTDLQPGGGGGGGAIGDGARGGDGGGGGEQVSALIDLVAMKAAGLDHIDVVVGKGGAVPTLPGQHSPKAADSLVRFIAKDGKILKEIRAGGGSGGKSASAYLPDDASELSLEDIQRGGFRITTFLPANSLQLHGGLVFVLGGGWVKFTLQSIPCPIAWSILCMARWNALEKNDARGLYVSLFHPKGHEVACQSLVLPAKETRLNNYMWVLTIGAEFDVAGQWSLRVHSGGFLLAEYNVDVFTG